jgi:hypothetical protein
MKVGAVIRTVKISANPGRSSQKPGTAVEEERQAVRHKSEGWF